MRTLPAPPGRTLELAVPRLGAVDAVGLELEARRLAGLVLADETRRAALELALALLDPPPRAPGEPELAFDHDAFLAGRHADVFATLAGTARRGRLTVLLDARALGGYDALRRASLLAAAAGAAALGPAAPAAAPALCILEALRDVADGGTEVGFAAVELATAQAAVEHLVLVHETLGPAWLVPDRCRLGGPGLRGALLEELRGNP